MPASDKFVVPHGGFFRRLIAHLFSMHKTQKICVIVVTCTTNSIGTFHFTIELNTPPPRDVYKNPNGSITLQLGHRNIVLTNRGGSQTEDEEGVFIKRNLFCLPEEIEEFRADPLWTEVAPVK